MKLLFVATEDWFFRSHFLHLARRAQDDGYEVVLAARDTGALASISDVRLIDTPFSRRSLMPWDVGRQIAQLTRIIDRERPDVVHAIALKPIALLLLTRGRRTGRLLALTGRGYLALGRDLKTSFVSWRFRRMVRRACDEARTLLLVENEADRAWVERGRPLDEDRVVLMPGAGVDPRDLTPAPEPNSGPIVIGMVSRLIRSKGIDIAVEAMRRLRAGGAHVVLRIAGAPDFENPEHVLPDELERWRSTDGVELIGRIEDVAGFWASTHICCLPSRGGEGLPRTLLEAAACGRPIVTTDVPGCREFVTAGGAGLVVPREDAAALSQAISELAKDASMRQSMGEAARARVLAGYTEEHAAERASRAWRRVLAQR